MSPTVEVVAPSRLHFGLFSFGQPAVPQFGGAGVIVERPGLRLRIAPAEVFAAQGPLAERARRVVQRIAAEEQLAELPPCRIEILSAPPEHVGLGTGTQLTLAVTAGLHAFLGRPPLDAVRLAARAGRGARSAIGTYGFLHGGLLVEGGKRPGETLSPLEQRVDLPAAWRFVLVCPRVQQGLAGDDEQQAFRDLPPVPIATTQALRHEVERALLPAARAGDFKCFSESLYQFGYRAGMCFAQRQGGPFASPAIARLVARIRELGVAGVGQSSWGPTVFALIEDHDQADSFCEALRPSLDPNDSLIVTAAARTGATITRTETP